MRIYQQTSSVMITTIHQHPQSSLALRRYHRRRRRRRITKQTGYRARSSFCASDIEPIISWDSEQVAAQLGKGGKAKKVPSSLFTGHATRALKVRL